MRKTTPLLFLDTLIHRNEDGTIKLTIYRKPTHTDQYLDFNSNHHITQKIGLIQTFNHRINAVVTKVEDRKKETNHIKQALKRCGHPEWVLNRTRKKENKKDQNKKERKQEDRYGSGIVIPYIKKTSEKVARELRRHGFRVIYKPTGKIKSIVCQKKKQKINDLDKAGVIYSIYCKKHNEEYIGETGRELKNRAYEHRLITHKDMKENHTIEKGANVESETVTTELRRSKRGKERQNYKEMNEGKEKYSSEGTTPVAQHITKIEHEKEDIQLRIIGREQNKWKRELKEALEIKRRKPTLNQDEGKQYISPLYSLLPSNHAKITGSAQITGNKAKSYAARKCANNNPTSTSEEER